jgi:hypothetical protein
VFFQENNDISMLFSTLYHLYHHNFNLFHRSCPRARGRW